jgi:hypothetical protein
MTADHSTLVKAARDLLLYSDPETAGLWPRAAALLARQALEMGLDEFWLGRAPGVQNASARAQLLCLPTYMDPRTARKADHAWEALSRACHHHPYELAPTATELSSWIDDVDRVLQEASGERAEKWAP